MVGPKAIYLPLPSPKKWGKQESNWIPKARRIKYSSSELLCDTIVMMMMIKLIYIHTVVNDHQMAFIL